MVSVYILKSQQEHAGIVNSIARFHVDHFNPGGY